MEADKPLGNDPVVETCTRSPSSNSFDAVARVITLLVAAVNVSATEVMVTYSSQILAAVVIEVASTSALVAPMPSDDIK